VDIRIIATKHFNVDCLAKSFDKGEKLDWKPLYLDAQATTPMVGNKRYHLSMHVAMIGTNLSTQARSV